MCGSVQTTHHADMDGDVTLNTFGLETAYREYSDGLFGPAAVSIDIPTSLRHLLHSILHLSPHQATVFAAIYL